MTSRPTGAERRARSTNVGSSSTSRPDMSWARTCRSRTPQQIPPVAGTHANDANRAGASAVEEDRDLSLDHRKTPGEARGGIVVALMPLQPIAHASFTGDDRAAWKAPSRSSTFLISRIWSVMPIACPPACNVARWLLGVVASLKTATREALGTPCLSSSSRFRSSSVARRLTPVTLPPGRARLATLRCSSQARSVGTSYAPRGMNGSSASTSGLAARSSTRPKSIVLETRTPARIVEHHAPGVAAFPVPRRC
jgi:hypothetical protein